MVSHIHDSFHSFVFLSILLPDISLARSPHHRSPPHILLLRPLFFPFHPSHLTHPMSSSIFSSLGHSMYTQKAPVSLFFLSHTQRSPSYFHPIPLEHFTGIQPPLTINLTLAHTLPFADFSFLVGSSRVHTVVFSYSCQNHFSTISCHTPGFSPQKSYFTHLSHTSFQS